MILHDNEKDDGPFQVRIFSANRSISSNLICALISRTIPRSVATTVFSKGIPDFSSSLQAQRSSHPTIAQTVSPTDTDGMENS